MNTKYVKLDIQKFTTRICCGFTLQVPKVLIVGLARLGTGLAAHILLENPYKTWNIRLF